MGNAIVTPKGPQDLQSSKESDLSQMLTFSLEELRAHTGLDGREVSISLLGDVYDVSADRAVYGQGGALACYAGQDISRAVAKKSLELHDIENLEVDDLDREERQVLEEWLARSREEKKYPVIGRLVIQQDLTLKQLLKYNGEEDPRCAIYIGLCGTIYDVTANGKEYYGSGGSYEQFAGRDASRALACMSFDPEFLDDPDLSKINSEQQAVLSVWCKKFQQKYAIVGRLLDE
uniref:Heme/steroid binding domaincontaining protein putati n=1 Tax=Albugo laibachii Nc14 TaxID=890382 RepID=F0WXC0_9STRA|nr:heme/steroid binding domaincontaining protein putati [Albugo laibachii Nc14]|eukprot:CCA26112.1 heme/steroid binding domaincontaining protein putati [Albugo laibachii Nc14]